MAFFPFVFIDLGGWKTILFHVKRKQKQPVDVPRSRRASCAGNRARAMTCGGLSLVGGVNLMCQDTRKQTQEPRSQFKKINPRH